MQFLKLVNIMPLLCYNLLTLCVQSNPAFSNSSFHAQTNSSWLKQMRNVSSKSKDYEIVQLRILSKRSADDKEVIRVYLSAFGKDIHLHLQRNDDFSDKLKALRVYEAAMTDNGVEFKEIILEDDDPGVPYIDPVQMAAVTIYHTPDGALQLDGVIGDDLLIKPASTDINFLAEFFDYDGNFIFENDNRIITFGKDGNNSFENSSLAAVKSGIHLVYRSLTKSKVSHKVARDDVFNSIDPDDDGDHRKKSRHAWPEVLLLVDFNTYAMHAYHGFNETQMRRYYISFLNGVDLRFKTLSNPKISLILSQIVIFKSMAATPFLKENLNSNTNIFNGDKAMRALARYLYSAKQDFYPEFDVAVFLTNLDMCAEEFLLCNPNTVGLAYFMGACTTIHSEERWMGVAIVEDNGGFDGILTAAHEIGHLLGADHDGDPHFHLSLQHTSICSEEDGYLMSHKLASDRIFQWSECSIQQFRHFLNSERASCLFNQPNHPNELEGSLLPGVVLSLDEQCKRIWGTRACAWDSRVCFYIHCYADEDDVETCMVGLAPAAEGSPCGEDLHCRHGKCVSKYLIYSQAWNMAPVKDRFKHTNSLKISPTKKSFAEACTEDRDEFFCESYFWTIGRKDACKNSRIIEECCYSHKILCKKFL